VSVDVTVPCVPPKTAHHAKRIVRVGGFARLADKPELTSARHTLLALLQPHAPAAPLVGPVALVIDLTWPWLAGDGKRTRALGRIPHDTKPDWDNAGKTLADVLVTLRYLEQDSRIVDGRVRKWRGDSPGIRVQLAPWAQDGAA
jgi:Holliday junction resolvase RusA-like endonuclease